MKQLQKILQEIDHLEQRGESFAIATVVNIAGSTYRGKGARMLISETGKTIGSISGGCLEGDIYERARKVIESGKPLLVKYDTTSEEDIYFGTGMGCGGVTEVLIEYSHSRSGKQYFRQLSDFFRGNIPVVLATVYGLEGHPAASVGEHLIVTGDAPHPGVFPAGPLQEAVTRDARAVLQSGKTVNKRYTFPDGHAEVLLEYISPPVAMIIFGGEHDVFPVTEFASRLGWHITVVDFRELFATRERFPQADEVLLWDQPRPPDALAIDARSVCLIMTHQYLVDKKILQFLLPSPARYIGFLGPAKRATQLLEELRSEGQGITPKQLDRLYSPVGLDIGAETAEEVALSIIAEIQAVISNREGAMLRKRRGPIHER